MTHEDALQIITLLDSIQWSLGATAVTLGFIALAAWRAVLALCTYVWWRTH